MLNFFVLLFLMIVISKILIIIFPKSIIEIENEIWVIICTIVEFLFLIIEVAIPPSTAIYCLFYKNAEMLICKLKMTIIEKLKRNIQRKKERILKLPKFTSIEQLIKFAEEGITDVA